MCKGLSSRLAQADGMLAPVRIDDEDPLVSRERTRLVRDTDAAMLDRMLAVRDLGTRGFVLGNSVDGIHRGVAVGGMFSTRGYAVA